MKILVAGLLFISAAHSIHANQCPAPREIYIKEGNKIVPIEPMGWQWAASWDTPKFESDNIQLNWAMWSSNRIHPEDENRVHCIYGDPEFTGTTGGILQTRELVPRDHIPSSWEAFGDDYFRCMSTGGASCIFGDESSPKRSR